MIQLIEIEPNTNRFRTQLSNDKNVAQFVLENNKMFVWGGRGEWVEFNDPYKIVTEITEQIL